MIVTMPSRKRGSWRATTSAILSSGAWSPRIEKMPSKMTSDAARPVRHVRQVAVEIRDVVVREDRALRRRHVGDAHRPDDAVVIQGVANPEGVRP